MTTPTMTAPLPRCVTIDAQTPDGYLDNARAGTHAPGTGANSDTTTALKNLSSCVAVKPPSTQASIVGHGDMGIIATGGGQTPSGSSQYIAVSNELSWTTALGALKGQITDLYLYGCQVGAGDDGAQLLFDMAKIVNATVWAPTSLIYCDGQGNFTLDKGGQWQKATAAGKPATIEPPILLGADAMPNEARLHLLGNQITLPIEQLAGATYTPMGPNGTQAPADPDTAGALTHEVDWGHPITPGGEPNGLITGRLEVVFGHGKRPLKKSFLVYSHALIGDEDEDGVYYRLTPHFRAIAHRK